MNAPCQRIRRIEGTREELKGTAPADARHPACVWRRHAGRGRKTRTLHPDAHLCREKPAETDRHRQRQHKWHQSLRALEHSRGRAWATNESRARALLEFFKSARAGQHSGADVSKAPLTCGHSRQALCLCQAPLTHTAATVTRRGLLGETPSDAPLAPTNSGGSI